MTHSPSSSRGSIDSQIGDRADSLISGWHHVNLLVQPQTLHLARAFYADVLGLESTPVPESKKSHLMWFNIGTSGQQLHITSEHNLNPTQMKAQSESPRHPCFKVPAEDKLVILQQRLWVLCEQGGEGAPVQCDQPGTDNGGQGQAGEFPSRFFARDYAGNRLEFTV